jgi:hypothetical protein
MGISSTTDATRTKRLCAVVCSLFGMHHATATATVTLDTCGALGLQCGAHRYAALGSPDLRNAMPRTAPPALGPDTTDVPIVWVALDTLRPHPRNDGRHPPEELAHLKHSLQEHGIYRNVVLANDGTILAGTGVVKAAQELGRTHMLARCMPYGPDDPRALKILIGDNHIARLRMQDDAALVAVLQDLADHGPLALLGTGFDEDALEALVAAQGLAIGTIPEPAPQAEPRLPSECFIEIYCAQSDLAEFEATLMRWNERATVRVNIV